MQKIGNFFVKLLLRSPLHGLLSKQMLLITFTGRKSGKTYTTPVSYLRDGDELVVYSQQDRVWWRNLLGGAPVTLTLRGDEVAATGTAYEDDEAIRDDVYYMLRHIPIMRRFADIEMDDDGQFQPLENVETMVQDGVIVRFSDL